MKKSRGKFFLMGVVFAALILNVSVATQGIAADKVIELKLASMFPPMGPNAEADKAWMKKIHDETGGKVHITPYYGGTLISMRESVRDISKGVCDIGYTDAQYASAGFPLNKIVGNFFYGVPDGFTARQIFLEVWASMPELRKEFESVKVMAINAGTPYQLITKKPVRTLADLKGMTIKCPEGYHPVLKELGAQGIVMSMGDVYLGIQKGTIDGCFAPYEPLKSFKFAEVAKYATRIDCAMPGNPRRGFNWDSFNKLPPDIQKIFERNIDFFGFATEKFFEDNTKDGISFAKSQGVEFIELPPKDLEKFYSILEKESAAAAARLDAKGVAATKLFKEVRRILKYFE